MKAQPFDVMQYFYSLVQPPLIRCCIRFDGKLEQRRLSNAVTRLLANYPILKCIYQSNQREWEDAGFMERDYLSIAKATVDEYETIIQEKLLSSLQIGIDPPIRFFWISGEERDALCVVVSHLICDGRGFEQLMYEFAKYYSTDMTYKQTDCVDNFFKRRDFGQVTERFSRIELKKILHSKAVVPSGDTQRSIPLTGSNAEPSILTRKIDTEFFEKVHTFAKQYHASINDIFLTAYARALQEQFGWKDITIPSPVDLRRFGGDVAKESVCNLTGNYYCNIKVEPQENFTDTLQKVSSQMSLQKAGNECLKGPMLFHLLYKMVPYPILKKLFFKISPVPVTSYTNLGNIDEARLRFHGIEVEYAFFATAIKPVPYFQLTVSTFRNQCTLSSCTYAGGKNLGVIQGLIDQIMKQLEEEIDKATI